MADRCERCGNDEEGDRIYYCQYCGTYFCDACLGDGVGELARMSVAVVYDACCPECPDGGWLGRTDRIRRGNRDDDDHDDDNEDDGDNYEEDDSSYYADYSPDTSYSSGDSHYSVESAAPRPPLPPDPRELQLAKAAAMSPSELEREIDLRIREEVARRYREFTPHSPSDIPLVTREDLIRFTVLSGHPLPHVVWMAESHRKGGLFNDGWGHFASLFIEARAAANPMVREAYEGLREQSNLEHWAFPPKDDEWSLSEYVEGLRKARRERQEAEDEARRQEQKEEAVRRASTPGRQFLRLSLMLIAVLVVAVFVGLPVIVGRFMRVAFGDHWSVRWLCRFENFLRDAWDNLPPNRIAKYIRTGE